MSWHAHARAAAAAACASAGSSFASAVNFTCARGATEEDFLPRGVRRQFFQLESTVVGIELCTGGGFYFYLARH